MIVDILDAMSPKRSIGLQLVLLGLLATTGCAELSYGERMDYLRTVAQRGVESHDLIASQEAEPTADRCGKAFEGVNDDIPYKNMTTPDKEEWREQVKQFFVDSCVSGKPKPVPGSSPQETTPTQPSATPTATP